MEKEKTVRKKSTEKYALPVPPPDPSSSTSSSSLSTINLPSAIGSGGSSSNISTSTTTSFQQTQQQRSSAEDAFKRIVGYREREENFLKLLHETMEIDNSNGSDQQQQQQHHYHHVHGSGGSGGNIAVASGSNSGNGGAVGGKLMQDVFADIDFGGKEETYDSYVTPLLKRTGPSISAALVTEGAIDQLDKLHGILNQLLDMQAQNYRLRRTTRDVNTLNGLRKLQMKDLNKQLDSNLDISDGENELELEYNEALLETILAAGKSASNKRNSSKRHRLKNELTVNHLNSFIMQNTIDKDSFIIGSRSGGGGSSGIVACNIGSVSGSGGGGLIGGKQYPLRRQSAITDLKAKVSKWTKVKAAFKWERANPSLNEGKSTDSGIGLSPINNEVARYLRVPSIPCTGSSADSVLSSSSGHMLSGGSSIPPTPGTMSSASSIEDIAGGVGGNGGGGVGGDSGGITGTSGNASKQFRNDNRDSSKSESRCESRTTQDDDARRSRSLDGDVTLCPSFTRQLEKNQKNKTPWRKVKAIIQTHRGSLKGKPRSRSVKSVSSVGCSRDASPCESIDAFSNVDTNFDRTESCSSSQTSPIRKNYPSLMLTAPVLDAPIGSSPNSPSIQTSTFFDHHQQQQQHHQHYHHHQSHTNESTGSTTRSITSSASIAAAVATSSSMKMSASWVTPILDYDINSSSGLAAAATATTVIHAASTNSSRSISSSVSSSRGSSRKSKMVLDIACLPEGIPLDLTTLPPPATQRIGKPPPSPLNLNYRQMALHHDSSDTDQLEQKSSPALNRRTLNWQNRNRLSANVSAPNSPSRQFEFFGEFESEDLSSGDFSEPCTPHTQLSPKSSLACQTEEINRKYYELQQQISLEFQAKQREWERIRHSTTSAGNSSDDPNSKDSKNMTAKPIEENLTADFKKKLQEWRIKKQQSQSNTSVKDAPSPTKESDNKKIDWHLWKIGQIKLEGQGLKQMPDEKDLPEDFQRKLDEWKRIKASGGGGGSSLSSTAISGGSSTSTATSTITGSGGVISGDQASSISSKRQSLKSNQLLKYEFGSSKKLKSLGDDLTKDSNKQHERDKAEKLFKLKSMVAEPPAKEVVVQTSKGVLKFEGISRKFTRKLYEWEKARGIGPEASTFALLHPGYRPLMVGNGEGESENGSPMGRSLSMDSVSPHNSVPSISHQPSSLSLNNVDDLIDTNSITGDRKSLDNFDQQLDDSILNDIDDIDDDDIDDDQAEEPEAVIVEVEDDYIETAASLYTATPIVEQQTPVYRYEQTRKEYYSAGKKEAVFVGESKPNISYSASKALQEATKMVTSFKDVKHGFKENIAHVQLVLHTLIDTLPTLKLNLQSNSKVLQDSVDVVKNLAKEIVHMLTELEETASSKEEIEIKMTTIDYQLNVLKKTMNFLCKHTAQRKTSRNEDVPEISITSDDAIEKNIAIVSVTPEIFESQVVVNEVKIMEDRSGRHHQHTSIELPTPPPSPPHSTTTDIPFSSESCSTNTTTATDVQSVTTVTASGRSHVSEQDAKKITRNLNNGTKRKTKLRRLGSRQNSKTESDSDEDVPSTVDTTRRIKRKTSKAKRLGTESSIDKTDEAETQPIIPTTIENVTFVLKNKPNQQTEEFTMKTTPSESLQFTDTNRNNMSHVFVKTKRKIFTLAEDKSGAAIAKDIESSSASDKNDNDGGGSGGGGGAVGAGGGAPAGDISMIANQIIKNKSLSNLPPLPHSPGMQRRLENKSLSNAAAAAAAAQASITAAAPPKEPSPAIRVMIAKYNQRLSAERRNSSPQSSGSCSPVAWRSPVLERRVRNQTEKYMCQVTKSLSAGNVKKELKLCELKSNELDGVFKSSSAGILSENWTAEPETTEIIVDGDDDLPLRISLACDSLKKIAPPKKMIGEFPMSHEKVYRKNTEYPIYLPLTVSKSGTFKKIQSKSSIPVTTSSTSALIESADKNVGVAGGGDCYKLPDKLSNTVPKIKRKLDGKPPSPKFQHRGSDLTAEPITASLLINIRNPALMPTGSSTIRGNLPDLNDRAQKLRKAKEDFLKMSNHRSPCCSHEEEIWKNRVSQISAGSESSSDEILIQKSASVGMIHSPTNVDLRRSDYHQHHHGRNNGNNNNSGSSGSAAGASTSDGYVSSLPRNTTRTSKSQTTISDKFGFSSIASKFRKVKLRVKEGKEAAAAQQQHQQQQQSDLNAVSRLCRQSLMVDIAKVVDQHDRPFERNSAPVGLSKAMSSQAAYSIDKQKSQSAEKLKKSGSGSVLGSILFRRHERSEKLKKSKSIGQLDEKK